MDSSRQRLHAACLRQAAALRDDPELLERAAAALARLEGRSANHGAWQQLLAAGTDAVLDVLVDDTQASASMRADSPLALVLGGGQHSLEVPSAAAGTARQRALTRGDVLHVARAAARVAGVVRVVVLGSSAVLGSHTADQLPDAVLWSTDVDVWVPDDLHGDAAQRIAGAIGVMSRFHHSFGYWADGLEASEFTLPDGWQGRLIAHDAGPLRAGGEVEAVALFPELCDLIAGKLAAGRPQDLRFAGALLGHRHRGERLFDPVRLREAVATLEQGVRTGAQQRLEALERSAGAAGRVGGG